MIKPLTIPSGQLLALSFGLLFAAVPSSSNYTLKSYDVGTGGTSSSTSTNYQLNGISGAQAGSNSMQSSTSYGLQTGVNSTINSNVPPAPTFTNPSNYYDRLILVVNTGSNPTDTKYLIAISADNFATTSYVQSDNSIASSQAIANYQSYAAWGGASGFAVLGLQPATTYKVKVKALQGKFTGSIFGPTASAATVSTSVSVSLTTSLTSTPPFVVDFTSLTPGNVTNGNADAVIGLTSNANNGGTIYVRDINAGLLSTLSGNTIASNTADLSVAASGYGAQVTSVSQASGGPLASQPPYNGSASNVGGLLTALQPVMSTTGPVTNGSGTVRLMAKASLSTQSASDYGDTVTLVVAMNF